MRPPNRGNSSGGWTDKKKFGSSKPWERSGGRDFDKPTMYEAVCSECGKDCEVPFRPTGSRPVFCSNCFKKDENPSPRRFEGRGGDRFESRESRSSFDQKPLFKAVCEKCGSSCEVPFRPNGSKPVYCKACFAGSDTAKNSNTEQTKEQFKIVNSKLDAILKILKPTEIELDEKAIDAKVEAPEKPAKKKAAAKKKK
ncbi:MAG: CxxC-x17-CxxC domain-containing protein [Patescibacteria group bacterium]|jgi:CxxC-x17-CxxC domain-containing protein